MGVAQALYTGVTGISVNSDGMSVTANNIANANAKGFKRDRAEFADMLSNDISSMSGPAQIGRGSRVADVRTIHTQGGLKVTDNITDLAVQGKGFFVVSMANKDVENTEGKLYTRMGSLQFDKDGYLTTSDGGRVQGYMADANGNLSSRLRDIHIKTNNIAPHKTHTLELNVQLDSRSPILEDIEWNDQDPEKTSNFNTTVTVFDSHGRAHPITMYFRKTEATEDEVEWEWHAVANGKEVTDADEDLYKEFANGTVRFDKHGFLLEEITNESSVNFSNGAFPEQEIKFDFGRNIGEEQGNGLNSSTSIAGDSITIFHQQDGFESGNLKSIRIGLDGKITGVFSNGIQRTLSNLALATFANEDALEKAGKNQFAANLESGPANIGFPETGVRGTIYSSSLEESNVDLANEFVNMILNQRLFQANSRTITTTDTMVEEIINLKR